MPGKPVLTLISTLLITVALILILLFVGGSPAVTLFVSVIGLLLSIVEFFWLHVLSDRQGSSSSEISTRQGISDERKNSSSHKVSRESRLVLHREEEKKLRPSKFIGREE